MSSIPSPKLEFRRGGPTLLAAFFGVALGMGAVPIYTIGVFAPELRHAFGWSQSFVMLGFIIASFAQVLITPLVGYVVDRVGVRRVVLICVPGFALSFGALALNNGTTWAYVLTWMAIAAFGVGTTHLTWTRAVNSWFDRYKGTALGFALVGTGLFGSLIKPALHAAIESWGWRGGILLVAALPLMIAWPLAWLLFRERPATNTAAAATLTGLSFAEVLRTRQFWILAVVAAPMGGCMAAAVPNLEGILQGAGFAPGRVVVMASAFGVSVMAGRLIGGFLLDRLWAPMVVFVGLSLAGVAFLTLATPSGLSIGAALAAIVIYGLAGGLEYDAIAYFIARHFGLRNYSTIYGAIYALVIFGVGIAPPLFGYVLDRTGSFTLALRIAGSILPVCAVAFLFMGHARFSHQSSATQV